jgi:hypothetical protein
MQGFMFLVKADLSKEEMVKNLDASIEKAKSEMETSIENNPILTSEETVKSSQKLDALIAHRQRMKMYGYQ